MNKRYLSLASGVALLAASLSAGAPLAAQDNPGNKTDVRPADEGKDLYEQICQACHMADAKGGAALAPGFRRWRPTHLADKAFAIGTVWNGRGGMPRFGALLSPAQVAAVLTYVRGHFNAYPDPVSEADAGAGRASRCRPIATPAATKLSHQEGCPPCSTISARKPAAACFR
jgi:mono/diheme cytochrome c family protein